MHVRYVSIHIETKLINAQENICLENVFKFYAGGISCTDLLTPPVAPFTNMV